MSRWGGGAIVGALYRLAEIDNDRLGNCWMAGRIKNGDLALCVQHSGDCFYDYILVKELGNGLRGLPGAAFGAYTCGEFQKEVPNRVYHLLAAGEFVEGA